MKKGLFLALLMVAVVAMALPAAGRAPVIQDLPDIVIGDTGDISAGTTAARLYRYLNVLNVLDSSVIEWRNGFGLAMHHVFVYRNAATDPINIRASKRTAFANTLSNGEYTALLASGAAPGAGTDLIDAGTTFTYLSLMNMDIVTGSPANAYDATTTSNGVATASLPAGAFGATDMVLAAVEVDLPTTPTLVDTEPFTVYTVQNSDDYTTGLIDVFATYNFVGGSNDGWYAYPDQSATSGFAAATTAIDTTAGAIGFDASQSAAVTYGTWILSDNGTSPKFLIPGTGMEGKVYRVRFGLTSTATTRANTCSWRMFAISYLTTSLQGVQVLTTANGDDASIDAPINTAPLAAQIHFAIPYELGEWGTGEALDTAPAIDSASPADFRNLTLNFDGIDYSDTGVLLMDSCVIESYPRPADATPAYEWGGAGFDMNDTNDGYAFATVSGVPDLLNLGTGTRDADSVTLTMGAMPATPVPPATGPVGKWQQAGLTFAALTAKYAETAGELVRYTVECESSDPDIAPNVRFQTVAMLDAATDTADNTIYWNMFGGSMGTVRSVIANTTSVIQPSAPRTAANGGSTLDLYRYIMNTSSRYLAFNWDCYGLPGAGTWAAQTGSFTVTSIKLNGHLSNP